MSLIYLVYFIINIIMSQAGSISILPSFLFALAIFLISYPSHVGESSSSGEACQEVGLSVSAWPGLQLRTCFPLAHKPPIHLTASSFTHSSSACTDA